MTLTSNSIGKRRPPLGIILAILGSAKGAREVGVAAELAIRLELTAIPGSFYRKSRGTHGKQIIEIR
jgi:hypothetical protein